MDERLGALALAFAGAWSVVTSTCPLCQAVSLVTAPALTGECDHFLARLVPNHRLVLLRGRSSFEQASDLVPALDTLPVESDRVSQLIRAGYHLGDEVVEPVLTAASKVATDTWPLECDLDRVVDLFTVEANHVIALIEEALSEIAVRRLSG